MAKFKEYVSPVGTLAWPYFLTPTAFEGGEEHYKCDLVLDEQEAAEFAALVDGLHEECCNTNAATTKKKAAPPYKPALDKDKNEIPGKVAFRFKVKAVIDTKKGPWDRQPKVFDAQGTPLTGIDVGGGTKARIAFTVYSWATAGLGCGVTLQPVAVQVIDLVEKRHGKSAEGYGFGNVEGGFVAADAAMDENRTPAGDGNGGEF
jgi:hypothetical protein